MRELLAKPLPRALAAAVVVSGSGIAINVATDLKTNLLAWFAVVALTFVSALIAAATAPGETVGGDIVDREANAVGRGLDGNSLPRWAGRRTRKTTGVVMRREVETKPDRSRTERIDFFSVEVALKHLAAQNEHEAADVPPIDGEELEKKS